MPTDTDMVIDNDAPLHLRPPSWMVAGKAILANGWPAYKDIVDVLMKPCYAIEFLTIIDVIKQPHKYSDNEFKKTDWL